jgi:hypothetical protein
MAGYLYQCSICGKTIERCNKTAKTMCFSCKIEKQNAYSKERYRLKKYGTTSPTNSQPISSI